MSGVSTVVNTAMSTGSCSAATSPARTVAASPVDQSTTVIGRAGWGGTTIAAPNMTRTSAQPPSDSARTARRNHSPSATSTFGIPMRVPAPAANTIPTALTTRTHRPSEAHRVD
jgi:hypothetical protein